MKREKFRIVLFFVFAIFFSTIILFILYQKPVVINPPPGDIIVSTPSSSENPSITPTPTPTPTPVVSPSPSSPGFELQPGDDEHHGDVNLSLPDEDLEFISQVSYDAVLNLYAVSIAETEEERRIRLSKYIDEDNIFLNENLITKEVISGDGFAIELIPEIGYSIPVGENEEGLIEFLFVVDLNLVMYQGNPSPFIIPGQEEVITRAGKVKGEWKVVDFVIPLNSLLTQGFSVDSDIHLDARSF